MLPISESSGAIPLGLLLGLPMESSFIWAQIGNMIPIFFILLLLEPTSEWLMKHSGTFKKHFSKLLTHTREKHTKTFERFGAIFLIVFIAVPFPGTGAWTGALISFLFDIPYWRAILFILIGNIASGVLLLLGLGSAMELLRIFQQ